LELESEILRKTQRTLIKNFLDWFILLNLGDNSLSGYDVIGIIHQRFDVLVSSGTIYARLYLLEREGLIEAEWTQRKRVYKLTEKGRKTAKAMLNVKDKIHTLLTKLFIGR